MEPRGPTAGDFTKHTQAWGEPQGALATVGALGDTAPNPFSLLLLGQQV